MFWYPKIKELYGNFGQCSTENLLRFDVTHKKLRKMIHGFGARVGNYSETGRKINALNHHSSSQISNYKFELQRDKSDDNGLAPSVDSERPTHSFV